MQQPGLVSPDGYWVWNGSQWVPNSYAPLAFDPGVTPYEPADFRAMLTSVFLAMNVMAVLLAVLFDMLDAGNRLEGSPHDGLFIAAGLVALLGLLAYYASLIPAIVFFCMWLHRVVRNMPSLGAIVPRWTPGGAVGRCFIPFLNFVHPLLSVVDAWRGSSPRSRTMNRRARAAERVPFLIAAWWTAFLLSRAINAVAFGFERSSDTDSKLVGLAIDAVGQVVLITAAVLAIWVVRRLTARQNLKFHLISSGQLV